MQEEIHLFMGVRPNLCLINLLLGLKKTITNTLTSSKAGSLAPRIITPQMFQESLPKNVQRGRALVTGRPGIGHEASTLDRSQVGKHHVDKCNETKINKEKGYVDEKGFTIIRVGRHQVKYSKSYMYVQVFFLKRLL